MAQRAKITGAELLPDPHQYNGINAEKCVRYLRGIGVEIDDRTAESWLDTQAVHRMMGKMARPRYGVWRWFCAEDHSVLVAKTRGTRSMWKALPNICEQCGERFVLGRCEFYERNDGILVDRREEDDRNLPIAVYAAMVFQELGVK